MNQAILKPKEEDRYLAVVVPKDIKKPRIFDLSIIDEYGYKVYGKLTFDEYLKCPSIIGLLSEMTEEQAKEILDYTAGSVFNWYKNYLGKNKWVSYKNSMNSLIKASGLTYTSEQDVLLIKIN